MDTQSATATGSLAGQPILLNEKQVAKLIGVSVSKLQSDRFYRRGINFYKLNGRSIRYALTDIESYLSQSRIVLD